MAPLRFSALSFVSSLLWAAAVMGFVAELGPASLAELGVKGWWTPLLPAALVIAFSAWPTRAEQGSSSEA